MSIKSLHHLWTISCFIVWHHWIKEDFHVAFWCLSIEKSEKTQRNVCFFSHIVQLYVLQSNEKYSCGSTTDSYFVYLRMTAVTCVKLLVHRSQTTLQESAPPSADSAGWPSENLWDPLSAFIYRCRSYLLTGWFSGCVRLWYPDAGLSWTKWHKQKQSLRFWIHAALSQFGFWIHLLELCLFSCKNTEFRPEIYMLEKTQLHKCLHILFHTSVLEVNVLCFLDLCWSCRCSSEWL